MIKIENLNFTYPSSNKGIFDINFEVRKGQVVGFLGPNGAGKTTTIRCLLGFLRGDTGTVTINKKDCFDMAPTVAHYIGYIAGEPAFPESMTGREFLQFLINVRVAENEDKMDKAALTTRIEELIQYYELDTKIKIKRMSKGMKQKTAIIAAFMHNPDVLILDEPTSGLDPLMQAKFVDMLQSEKEKGKTILISSHMFEEIERTADRVVIIKNGRIVTQEQVDILKKAQKKVYLVSGEKLGDKLKKDLPKDFEISAVSDNEIEINMPADQVDKLIKILAKHKIDNLKQKEIRLEQIFMSYYGKEENEEVT